MGKPNTYLTFHKKSVAFYIFSALSPSLSLSLSHSFNVIAPTLIDGQYFSFINVFFAAVSFNGE